MKIFKISYKHSKNEKKWTSAVICIKACSEVEALMKVENISEYIRNVKIISVFDNNKD